MNFTRRQILEQAGFLLAASQLEGAQAASTDWTRTARILIAEAYNPPFYPAFDYEAEKAVRIARELNADSIRYPAASYFAYFPTKSGYPVHPELKGDPMRATLDLCRQAGLKTVAYVPMNHPFMDATSKDPRYAGWSKHAKDGSFLNTGHYGFAEYHEGCLNSPLREVIRTLVGEVLTYPFDVIYFDGPYQGMQYAKTFCHCEYCEAAYRQKFGKPVPDQEGKLSRADETEYTNWMTHDVAIAFLREIRETIRKTRDVPVLFNDTSLLSRREWRSRAVDEVDGFMFEAAETPEEKLFNLQLGHSTGKTIWTYVGSHTEYNREHMKDDKVRGWFSYPVESQELLIDGATATAAGAGLVYWGLPRFFYQPKGPLEYESGQYVKRIFDFEARHAALLATLSARPQVGILVGGQTIDWYSGKHFVSKGYENGFHGAYKLLKANSYEAEPFLDWQLSAEKLARYQMVWASNAVCLSDAQCALLREYVRKGGLLVATHLTSAADEYGRMRKNFGLADVFGAELADAEPIEIPDLYLHPVDGEELPQDPQIARFRAVGGTSIAETIDRGHCKNLGPAILRNTSGTGQAIYIGSSLDAVYEETRMKVVRAYIDSLIAPWLAAKRSYQLPYMAGVMPHLMASEDTMLLHLIADVGDKNKHLRVREEFVPVNGIRLKVRVPEGRTARRISLLRSGEELPAGARSGWIDLTVPRVWIHDAIRIDLA